MRNALAFVQAFWACLLLALTACGHTSADVGVTCLIDPDGQILGRTPTAGLKGDAPTPEDLERPDPFPRDRRAT